MTDQIEQARAPWRVGSHYSIHVYEGDRPVATFIHAEDAAAAVAVWNTRTPSSQTAGSEAMAVEVLREYQFASNPDVACAQCPACGNDEAEGHEAGCKIAAALSATAPPDGGVTHQEAEAAVDLLIAARDRLHACAANNATQAEIEAEREFDEKRARVLAIMAQIAERRDHVGDANDMMPTPGTAQGVLGADMERLRSLYEATTAPAPWPRGATPIADFENAAVGYVKARLRAASPAGSATDPQGDADVRRKALKEAVYALSHAAAEPALDGTAHELVQGALDRCMVCLIDTPASTGAGETPPSKTWAGQIELAAARHALRNVVVPSAEDEATPPRPGATGAVVTEAMVERAARALARLRIEQNRRHDDAAVERTEAWMQRCIGYAWRDYEDQARAALTAAFAMLPGAQAGEKGQ